VFGAARVAAHRTPDVVDDAGDDGVGGVEVAD
jgi:hypothetical protein